MRNNEERFEELKQQAAGQDPIQAFTKQEQGLSLNFISPTLHVPLPSKGKFYQDGHPLKGQETIEIKEMTAKEEDILTNRSLIKKGLVFDKLVSSIIVDKSIKVDDLLIGDKSAILMAARGSAYGDNYSFQVICPSCDNKTTKEISIEEILNKEKEEELLEDTARLENGNVIIKLPKTGWVVECKLLTSVDEQKIVKLAEAKKKINADAEPSLLDNLSSIVISIQGVTNPALIQTGIAAMPAKDSKFLRNTYQKMIPTVDMKTGFTCSKCDFEQEVEIPLNADFFWSK